MHLADGSLFIVFYCPDVQRIVFCAAQGSELGEMFAALGCTEDDALDVWEALEAGDRYIFWRRVV